jgi:Undecaprenyl-phosphate glucose phosphotransferase
LLRKYSEIFRTVCGLIDLAIVAAAWLGAYALRFHSGLLPPPPVHTPFENYAWLLVGILPLWHLLLHHRGLYEPEARRSVFRDSRALVEVSLLGTVILVMVTFFAQQFWVSRLTVLVFFVTSSFGLVVARTAMYVGIDELRRRGLNTQSLLIVGTGALAREAYTRFHEHAEMGFRVVGFLGPSSAGLGGSLPPHLGTYGDLQKIVLDQQIAQVAIALDRNDPADPTKMILELHNTTAGVRIVPDLLGLNTVQAGIDDLDGLPMVRVVESPLLGWPQVAKRLIDIVVSATGLVFGAPVIGGIAIGVRLSSPGPVFYRQERMGLDGRHFTMLKFRTMTSDAEADSGPVWATNDDPRRTRLGRFLRRFNLDEIPQLWNVLVGEMSLVGPRPERPEFIREFRKKFPGYMLRHKMKGGMTGWAQVNGCRGNTPVEKRLENDIAYLRRWSLLFDFKILVLTFVRAFNDPNAY